MIFQRLQILFPKGICDCCDGSDEWAAEKPCANTCNELGRAAREERERLTKVIAQGKSATFQSK